MSLNPDESVDSSIDTSASLSIPKPGQERYGSEPTLRAAFAQLMRDQGLAVEENVACAA